MFRGPPPSCRPAWISRDLGIEAGLSQPALGNRVMQAASPSSSYHVLRCRNRILQQHILLPTENKLLLQAADFLVRSTCTPFIDLTSVTPSPLPSVMWKGVSSMVCSRCCSSAALLQIGRSCSHTLFGYTPVEHARFRIMTAHAPIFGSKL